MPGIINVSVGEYKLFGGWWWWERESYSTVAISNTSSYDTDYQAISSYGSTDLLGGDNTVFLDNVRITPAPLLVPPQIGWQLTAGQLQLSWPLDHYGWHVEMQTNGPGVGLRTNWFPLTESQVTNSILIPLNPANGSAFLRLVYP